MAPTDPQTPDDSAPSGPEDAPPAESPAIRTIAMPADTNPDGDIFGGWLMSQMDLAAGTVAIRTARGRTATIAVEGMKFHRPVHVGDEVSLYARLLRIGTSSMRIRVEAWRRVRDRDEARKVTEAIFTFVALDDAGRPRPVQGSARAPAPPGPAPSPGPA